MFTYTIWPPELPYEVYVIVRTPWGKHPVLEGEVVARGSYEACCAALKLFK